MYNILGFYMKENSASCMDNNLGVILSVMITVEKLESMTKFKSWAGLFVFPLVLMLFGLIDWF